MFEIILSIYRQIVFQCKQRIFCLLEHLCLCMPCYNEISNTITCARAVCRISFAKFFSHFRVRGLGRVLVSAKGFRDYQVAKINLVQSQLLTQSAYMSHSCVCAITTWPRFRHAGRNPGITFIDVSLFLGAKLMQLWWARLVFGTFVRVSSSLSKSLVQAASFECRIEITERRCGMGCQQRGARRWHATSVLQLNQ